MHIQIIGLFSCNTSQGGENIEMNFLPALLSVRDKMSFTSFWIAKHFCLNTQKQLVINVCLSGLRDNFCSKDRIKFIYSCHHLHYFIWRCALSNYCFNNLVHFIVELVWKRVRQKECNTHNLIESLVDWFSAMLILSLF